MGLRAASETDTEETTSDDISSSSATEISDSSLDEVVEAATGTKKFVPKKLAEDGMSNHRQWHRFADINGLAKTVQSAE